MKTFAKQSNRDLSDVFNETALIMHLQPNVIEKDFFCFKAREKEKCKIFN